MSHFRFFFHPCYCVDFLTFTFSQRLILKILKSEKTLTDKTIYFLFSISRTYCIMLWKKSSKLNKIFENFM